eukprot:CAMPEP_0175066312 /NCGR_PEP_ID=MMETSP0052_2-20121109/16431_1 /TAXON_ID=51329 ORGANISM="Polytomella parva, Strain SAG 63-3" /NCGR_SAMPLE_ID=MMETSP0052_2 /ASSEMBLY_ACC=CAM_ASM_000194 /LENGTH=454 /DNA_ID=CAMNT_0016332985 /DNA_START=68 /DNA_END=1428 /DNA_ORIENTATION=-
MRIPTFQDVAVDERLPAIQKGFSSKVGKQGRSDLSLTAADRFAMSLLSDGVQGMGVGSPHNILQDGKVVHQSPPLNTGYGSPTSPGGMISAHLTTNGLMSSDLDQNALDNDRLNNSWDNGLREILQSLEPNERSSKPVSLKDHRYPGPSPWPTSAAPPSTAPSNSSLSGLGATSKTKDHWDHLEKSLGVYFPGKQPKKLLKPPPPSKRAPSIKKNTATGMLEDGYLSGGGDALSSTGSLLPSRHMMSLGSSTVDGSTGKKLFSSQMIGKTSTGMLPSSSGPSLPLFMAGPSASMSQSSSFGSASNMPSARSAVSPFAPPGFSRMSSVNSSGKGGGGGGGGGLYNVNLGMSSGSLGGGMGSSISNMNSSSTNSTMNGYINSFNSNNNNNNNNNSSSSSNNIPNLNGKYIPFAPPGTPSSRVKPLSSQYHPVLKGVNSGTGGGLGGNLGGVLSGTG